VSSDCDSGCVRTLDRVRLSHEKSLSLSLSRDVSVRVHTCSRARDCVRMRDRVDLLMVEDGWRARCGWRGKSSSSNAMFPATDADKDCALKGSCAECLLEIRTTAARAPSSCTRSRQRGMQRCDHVGLLLARCVACCAV